MRFPWRRSAKTHVEIPDDFDDEFYLAAHDDVADAVENGDFTSGYDHYLKFGRDEGRPWSNKSGLAPFGRRASLGAGLYTPQTLLYTLPKRIWAPSLSGQRARGQLLIMVQHLRAELFYAGYSSFFAECAEVAVDFREVRVICFDHEIAPGLIERYLPGARIDAARDIIGDPIDEPDLVLTFDTASTLVACDELGLAHRTIYYCQDFEAGFHPYGYNYVLSLRALHIAQYIVISTPQLRNFLERGGHLNTRNIRVTVPVVKKLSARTRVPRRVFVYFRPEHFNTRNMADLLMRKILDFCETHSGYDFFLVGTVATDLSITHGDNSITMLSKLSFEQYEDLAMSCEIAISMIYSAHPGVVAYQTALSGIPTITNVFDNRSAEDVVALSPNLIPYDVVRDSFDDVLARAFAHIPVPQERFQFGDASETSSVEFIRGVGRAVAEI